MNKKKFVILALLMIAVISLTSCMLVACNKDVPADDTTDKIEATEGLLISNSDFKVVGEGDKYPLTINSWTGAKMYSTSTFRDDIIAGAIHLDKSSYDANKSSWDDEDDTIYNLLTAGNRYDNDDIKNTLMLYMPEESTNDKGQKIHGATAYGYTSAKFTLDRGGYYKLSVDVLTHDIGGKEGNELERGARIFVSSSTYAEFSAIDTKGVWKTYEIYVEGSKTSSTTLTLMLGLGKYSSSYQGGLTTGYAFFDNVVLEKIEDTESKTAKQVYEEKVVLDNTNTVDTLTTTTLTVPNGRFDFGTTKPNTTATPNNWSLVTGNRGEDSPAPQSLGWNAIIDTTNFDYTKYSNSYNLKADATSSIFSYTPAESLANIKNTINVFNSNKSGDNVFMLSQQLMTAQGIRSAQQITIEKNKVYELSIDLYTYGVHGAGVSLILSGANGKDIVIKGISSQKSDHLFIGDTVISEDTGYSNAPIVGASTEGWTTYTFYIHGNQFQDYSYNMTVWLGTDGTDKNHPISYHNFATGTKSTSYDANGTFANGWVFIDELNLKETTSLPAESATIKNADANNTLDLETQGSNYQGIIVDLSTVNLYGEGDNYVLHQTTLDALNGVADLGIGTPSTWTSDFDLDGKTSPIVDGIVSQGVVNIASEDTFNGLGTYPGLPYDIVDKSAYSIYANEDSSYYVETDTFTIAANAFYRVSLWVKTVDVSSTSGAYVYLLDKDNDDKELASFTKLNTLDIDEYTNDWCQLTFVIRGKEHEDSNVAFKFSLGTGTRFSSDTLTSGAMYIANINATTITYANYKSTSTSTYVKSIDLTSSVAYTFSNGGFDSYDHDDKNLETSLPLNKQDVAAMPENWTFSNSKLNPNTNNGLVAGVVAFDSADNLTFTASEQLQKVYPFDFTGFYPTINSTTDLNVYPGARGQLLTIGSSDNNKFAAGFSSASISLSANTYYSLSVYVKTINITSASVFLTGDSSVSNVSATSFVLDGDDAQDWTLYTFYIKVGQTSASLNLNLWLGQDTKYFDLADSDAAQSSGAVFFDNVVFTTIDEDDYNAATTSDTTKILSFMTDSFDAIATTVDSRDTLSGAKGWTGAVGTNQSQSNTQAGVIYVDENYLDATRTIDGVVDSNNSPVKFVDILSKDYKLDDIKISEEDEKAAMADDKYQDVKDDRDALIERLKNERINELKMNNWMPLSTLLSTGAHSGQRMLVINNTQKSDYTFTSSAITLKENSYYQVSVWVYTALLSDGEDEGAHVELYLGSANENDNPLSFKAIKVNEWTKYTFFVETLDEDVTSVTVKLSLGKYHSEKVDDKDVVSGLTSGFAFFDDVTVTSIDEGEFAAAEANDTTLKRTVAVDAEGAGDEDDDNTDSTDSSFNLDALWWMIPTIILGVAIIAVVVVLIVRKVKKQPAAKKKARKASAQSSSKAVETKHSKYDENKE